VPQDAVASPSAQTAPRDAAEARVPAAPWGAAGAQAPERRAASLRLDAAEAPVPAAPWDAAAAQARAGLPAEAARPVPPQASPVSARSAPAARALPVEAAA
jgi:hypothetical protein